jgi:hypothetical protein
VNCPSCGSPTRVGATFCGSCGARLGAAVLPKAPVPEVAAATPTLPPPPPPAARPQLPPPPPPPPPAPDLPVVSAPAATTPPPVVAVSPAAVIAASATGSTMIDVPTFGGPSNVPPPAPPAAAPPASPIDALDDRTRVAPPRRPRGTWRLVLPDGTTYPVSATTVIGRQPDAAAAPGATEALAIDDPDGLVSKSHAVLELEGGRLSVRDLGSTNGVVALDTDGIETDVTPAVATPLDDGYEIELGSYVIKIEKA